jgi:hypothetical protein
MHEVATQIRFSGEPENFCLQREFLPMVAPVPYPAKRRTCERSEYFSRKQSADDFRGAVADPAGVPPGEGRRVVTNCAEAGLKAALFGGGKVTASSGSFFKSVAAAAVKRMRSGLNARRSPREGCADHRQVLLTKTPLARV